MEEVMHKTVLSGAMALAVVGAAGLTASSAGAATLAGLRPAIESLSAVDTVACWRDGRYVRSRYCGRALPHEYGSREYAPRADAPQPPADNVRRRYFSRW
jgi:hypothetical protein